MEGPLVSVIIPVYNVEPYLEECVRSVCGQTYTHMEIILVDDGSTDNCGQLCDQLAGSDPRIQVIHQENSGISAARNAGLDVARGTYIYFVDSDDWIQETLVERTVELMERCGYDQCIWGTDIVEKDGERRYWGRRRPLTLRFSTLKQKRKVLCRWQLTYRLSLGACSLVFRREIIERNHLRFENEREIGAEDLDFTFRYLACCESLHYIPEPFYVYQRRNGSIMDTSTLQKRAVRMLCMIRLWEEKLSDQPLFQPFYPYAGANLVRFASNFIEDQIVLQSLAQMLVYVQASEDWPYLQQLARQGLQDRTEIRRACGLRLGGQVCGLYRYILEGDPAEFCRWERAERAYWAVRNLIARLLRRR